MQPLYLITSSQTRWRIYDRNAVEAPTPEATSLQAAEINVRFGDDTAGSAEAQTDCGFHTDRGRRSDSHVFDLLCKKFSGNPKEPG